MGLLKSIQMEELFNTPKTSSTTSSNIAGVSYLKTGEQNAPRFLQSNPLLKFLQKKRFILFFKLLKV